MRRQSAKTLMSHLRMQRDSAVTVSTSTTASTAITSLAWPGELSLGPRLSGSPPYLPRSGPESRR